MGWLSWCIKDWWGTKVMYCYVVKWPVFSLQRGSAKSPIAPSNFSSLWPDSQLDLKQKKTKKIEYSLKIKLPNPLCVQISKVDANKTCKTEKILHENPCKMGQAATGQGKQAQLNVTRILGWATSCLHKYLGLSLPVLTSFPISEFFYKFIRFLLHRSIVKSDNEIRKLSY